MSDEIPLPIIADKLEEEGRPGEAAAVRTLAHLEGYWNPTLESLLAEIASNLRRRGDRDMGDAVRLAMIRILGCRGSSGLDTGADDERLGITRHEGIEIQDRHGILDHIDRFKEVLFAWIDDPSPKLAGLDIRVRPIEGRWSNSGSVEVRLRCTRSGVESSAMDEMVYPDLVTPRLPANAAGDDGRDEHARRMIAANLDAMHRRLIDEIRSRHRLIDEIRSRQSSAVIPGHA